MYEFLLLFLLYITIIHHSGKYRCCLVGAANFSVNSYLSECNYKVVGKPNIVKNTL